MVSPPREGRCVIVAVVFCGVVWPQQLSELLPSRNYTPMALFSRLCDYYQTARHANALKPP